MTTDPEAANHAANAIQLIAGRFGIDWKTLVAQIINFCIVVYCLYRFALKPVIQTMAQREGRIADGLRYAEEMEQKLKEAKEEQMALMKKATIEAKEVVNAARDQAKVYLEEKAQEAVAKSEQMIKKAEEVIQKEHHRMLAEARQQIGQLVVATTEKVLSRHLSSDEQSRYAQFSLSEVNKESAMGIK